MVKSLALILLFPVQCFAWGRYGHEQINEAAVEALQGFHNHLADLLRANIDTVKRLAITPDQDWKFNGNGPGDPAQRRKIDSYEHPLHFFEQDAFAWMPLGSLDDYRAIYPSLQRALRPDPTKAPNAPAHGTAPWRILQLYDLGVAALKAHDEAKALLYLGAMGHYVGDMGQPFHGTINYDGLIYPTPAGGIHHVFEEEILERAAGNKARTDLLWNTKATNAAVLASMDQGVSTVPRSQIIHAVLGLVADSYDTIEPLLAAYAYQCKKAKAYSPNACVAINNGGRHPQVATPAAMIDGFAAYHIEDRTTVLQLAETRMGKAATLLVRLWLSAFQEAGSPSLNVRTVNFDSLKVLDNYPIPDYLP